MTSPFLASVHDYVGGIPHVMGPWQFELLRSHGLNEASRVVDIGCGTLRGGLHFIRYLDPGCYLGVDPMQELVDAGRELLNEAGLSQKAPVLGGLEDLQKAPRRSADFILTQSVLNHLGAEQIETIVAQVHRLLADQGQWLLTARISPLVETVDEGEPHPDRPGERLESIIGKAWFEGILADYGLVMMPVDGHVHPRALNVACVRRLDDQVASRIEQRLKRFLQWDTSPAGADQLTMVDGLQQQLDELGFTVNCFGDSRAPLLVAYRPAIGSGRSRVVVYNHYDVDEIKGGWNSLPLELTKSEGRWYGLGIADNKGALAVRLEALRDLDVCPELHWIIQGEEESGSGALEEYLQQNRLPDADWFLDENGKSSADGKQRLLNLSLSKEDQALVAYATRAGGEMVGESRLLDKRFVPGGCRFQQALPVGARYLALGTNDAETRIHGPNESIPIAGVVLHWIQFRALLKSFANHIL